MNFQLSCGPGLHLLRRDLRAFERVFCEAGKEPAICQHWAHHVSRVMRPDIKNTTSRKYLEYIKGQWSFWKILDTFWKYETLPWFSARILKLARGESCLLMIALLLIYCYPAAVDHITVSSVRQKYKSQFIVAFASFIFLVKDPCLWFSKKIKQNFIKDI